MPHCLSQALLTPITDTKQCVMAAFFRVSQTPASAGSDDIFIVSSVLILAMMLVTAGLFRVVVR
jgi:hypothetical protein